MVIIPSADPTQTYVYGECKWENDTLVLVELGEAFGQVLRAKRQSVGLTQEELAFRSSLHTTSISYLERGLRQPTLHTVFILSKVLQLKASDFVGEVENYEPEIQI